MNPIFQELPTKLGIYNLTQLLGVREHSELYLATQSYVDRAVVIEVLRPTSGVQLQVEFREAARLRAAVSLPQVAPVLESANTGSLNYLIQEEPQGRSLVQLEEKLSVEQAFTLIQRVAEVYCACAEQGVSARALMPHDIYTDGENFSFFSPVVAGKPHDGQRAEQMEQLAAVLEQTLSEEDVAKSNISIIIHWLRQGYGEVPMQWQPLAASLSTLRAAKMRGRSVPLRQRLRALIGSKRAMRNILKHAWLILGLLCIVGAVVGAGQFFEEEVVEERPALNGRYMYCGAEKNAWRVMSQPVSVEEYRQFLIAWNKMSAREKASLCKGLPGEEAIMDRTPLNWEDQVNAADSRGEWMGFRMSPNVPVRGVSYRDAYIYARYAKGEIAGADMVRTARRYAGEPMVEEWTSYHSEKHVPYEEYYLVFPDYSTKGLIADTESTRRDIKRSFRVVNKIKS